MIATLKQALRSLRLAPAFTLTVIATLAIGIGLNAAIFTVVDSILLKPLGYHDADRIVAIRTHFTAENRSIPRLGGDDYVDLARDVPALEATAQYQEDSDGFSVAGTTQYAPVALVTSAFTQIMGVQPLAGRLLSPAADHASDALLSAAFARNHFPSAQAAIGQSITYTGRIFTVVGVLPDGFNFPGKTDAWFQFPVAHGNRTSYNWRVLAKRRAGTSPAQLAASLAIFSANLARTYPEDRAKTIESVPLQDQLTGRIRPTLNLLMGSVAVILLIVCANVAHLQLVRATRQLRAVTIRTALGASRSVLALRGLAETSILAVAGSLCAILLAVPTLRLLTAIAPTSVPRLTDVHLNLDVFVFSVLISLALMVVSAMLPIWRSWHVDPANALRNDASRGTESRSTVRLRSTFIVAEVAITLTLCVAAVLLTRQLIAQSHQDLGFSPDRLLTLDSHAVLSTPAPAKAGNSPAEQAAEKAAWAAIGQANLARLESTIAATAAVPGVESAAAIAGAPLGFGGSNVDYAIAGKSVFTSGANLPDAEVRPITPTFFATMGMPILRGRNLAATDTNAAPTVLLVNQSLAQSQFPGQDPIGQRIMCGFDDKAAWWTIVGVVADIHADAPGIPPTPTFYVPVAQHLSRAADMQIVARTAADPAIIAPAITAALARSHPEVAIKSTTMRQNLSAVQQSATFRTTLFTLFAAVSILLAAIGMYGVTAYTVAQRRFEFGLRIALGANRTQLLTSVLRSALAVAAIGVALGILCSLSLQRIFGSVVGKLPAFDSTAYLAAVALVFAIALLATLIPARRAARVDPMTVLRSE